jgi:ADP-ribose pyrophosphatase YjhB (NUDIX family)
LKNLSCHNFELQTVEGDECQRLVCINCGEINYNNPRIVVGSLIVHKNKFLLCKRAIEPSRGLWTIPGGFLESNESIMSGVIREAFEEAQAKIMLDHLFSIFSLKKRNLIQIIYLSHLKEDYFAPGIESLDVQLFDYDNLPWNEMAFSSVRWVFELYKSYKNGENLPFLKED